MKHEGGCHCGAVRFAVEMEIKSLLSCNCSICMKRGTLLAFAPEESFTLLSGGDCLADYQFGKKRIHHHFCAICGVAPFGRGVGPDGTPMRAINVRCIDDIDLSAHEVRHFDGKSL